MNFSVPLRLCASVLKYSFFAFIFLLAGCQQKGWHYGQVASDHSQFNSALLRCAPENKFNGIEVQFLTGAFGTLGFLNVYCGQIPSNRVTVYIDGNPSIYFGSVMEGRQRFLLPPEAVEALFQALLSGQNVVVSLDGFCTELCSANFAKQYCKFSRQQEPLGHL